ncbi:uncharacterized protein si:zfos-911d5.4 [Corythoichthys intestinalis]|uniref:uncharacterized protein si:zfos-911d5.4 n=1 Tax=Corythoichthys intestinalis TaxID=161448 RepID=UPI0025A4DAE4|nr:uncharacterized protein si:zfos-911d5.4 [Corythoichthys intestinalis]XP_057682505.1 uncharacterized protein si:zfos-911d5.4 [Corythoichthys intestinalis]XP_057682506.1 uncharacterized protein si:zfos-911d5.4 [Corythoichthys intestinalis]
MLQLGSLLTQFHVSGCTAPKSSGCQKVQQTLNEFLQHVRKLTGLRKEYIYCNLRIPDQFQVVKDDINIVILTGHGVFCMDIKPWQGLVSAHDQNWHIQVKEKDQNLSNTCIQQIEDPIKAIMIKTSHLCDLLRRSGMLVHQNLFHPRVVFPSPECELSNGLRERRELVPHDQVDHFLRSFREDYVAWMLDALTPSWLSGHLSYRQIKSAQEVLRHSGTWDLIWLHSGEQLKGDFQGCRFIALDRSETDKLEFSTLKTMWALLGHTPQVTVKMYKRGSDGWLGKTLSATTTVPSDTMVIFRVSGEEADTKIPANAIHSITLSI